MYISIKLSLKYINVILYDMKLIVEMDNVLIDVIKKEVCVRHDFVTSNREYVYFRPCIEYFLKMLKTMQVVTKFPEVVDYMNKKYSCNLTCINSYENSHENVVISTDKNATISVLPWKITNDVSIEDYCLPTWTDVILSMYKI
jgi:hypothetical protein